MSYRKRWMSEGQILLTLAAGMLTVFASLPIAYQRFEYGTYGEDRWPLFITAYDMFKSNILFGVGANNYNFVVMKYIPAEIIGKWVYTVHNEYLLEIVGNRNIWISSLLFFYHPCDD